MIGTLLIARLGGNNRYPCMCIVGVERVREIPDVRDLAATPAAPAVDATFSDAGLLEPEVRGERAARDRGHSSAGERPLLF